MLIDIVWAAFCWKGSIVGETAKIYGLKSKKKILISAQKESCYLKNLLNCPRIRLNRSQSSLQYIFLVIKYWWLLLFEIFPF